MDHGLKLYEAAVQLHERHARDARNLGYEEMAKRAEFRARAAEARAEIIRVRDARVGPGRPV